MKNIIFFLVILSIFIVVVDIYTFRGVSNLSQGLRPALRLAVKIGFWLVTAVAILWLLWFAIVSKTFTYEQYYKAFTLFFGFFVLFYVPKFLFNGFQLLQDVGKLLAAVVAYFFKDTESVKEVTSKISRSEFLAQTGIVLASIPFLSIIHGIWRGRFNFKIQSVKLKLSNLPEAFHGTKIVQISDFHIGSFADRQEEVEKAVKLINEQKADYVLFTGDLVNNIASELEPFIPILQKIEAKEGKFSILGNHDYGEYYEWSSNDAWEKNMADLFAFEEKAGFKLLRNESVLLEKGDAKIALLGVENWGLPPFPQYGDLLKAVSDVKEVPFKLLMSHDPSHWDAEVRKKTDIDLTLSGHTHGMQFGIRIPGWRWSPVKFKYPRWGGLYREGDHLLYVNTGIGFIGFPGRVGMPPEITVFELECTKA